MKYPNDPDQIATEMQEVLLNEAAPEIGIFWLIGGEVITFSVLARDAESYAGFRDSPHDHINAWPSVQKTYPAVRGKEYDEVPRGRVTYTDSSGRYQVLMPPELIGDKNMRRAIASEFSLPIAKSDFVGDEHYAL